MRFIMSPPGKRRHNELNAAPPPETPQGTGKPGEVADRDFVHSRESFGIMGKTCLFGEPRGTAFVPANVTFCFTDGDFPIASSPIRFSFSAERKTQKKKDRSGGSAAK